MNIQSTSLLIDGLFARKVIKIIKSKEFNELILNEVENQMKHTLSGIDESSNYETSTKNSLKYLNAYGNAITIVQSSPDLIQNDDCIGPIAKTILKEIKLASEKKQVSPKTLPTTLKWYEKIRSYSLNQGSRFNIQPSPKTSWGIVTKF